MPRIPHSGRIGLSPSSAGLFRLLSQHWTYSGELARVSLDTVYAELDLNNLAIIIALDEIQECGLMPVYNCKSGEIIAHIPKPLAVASRLPGGRGAILASQK